MVAVGKMWSFFVAISGMVDLMFIFICFYHLNLSVVRLDVGSRLKVLRGGALGTVMEMVVGC